MKKFILSVMVLGAMVMGANAVTYMRVHTTDGNVVKYDVLQVLYVDYVEDSSAEQGVSVSGQVGNYTYVDLGLESGTKWATYNVGASLPTGYGDHFAWGETAPKVKYDWTTYEWCSGDSKSQTKYCMNSKYGTVDNQSTLLAEDDAATVNWGEGWRMPTKTEQDELRDGCDWTWTDNFNGSGVAGQIGTSKTNGNTIFLPATGYFSCVYTADEGASGSYWSSSLIEERSDDAFYLYFKNADGTTWHYDSRQMGYSVRAVVKE